jgi:hypothetical protein
MDSSEKLLLLPVFSPGFDIGDEYFPVSNSVKSPEFAIDFMADRSQYLPPPSGWLQ